MFRISWTIVTEMSGCSCHNQIIQFWIWLMPKWAAFHGVIVQLLILNYFITLTTELQKSSMSHVNIRVHNTWIHKMSLISKFQHLIYMTKSESKSESQNTSAILKVKLEWLWSNPTEWLWLLKSLYCVNKCFSLQKPVKPGGSRAGKVEDLP